MDRHPLRVLDRWLALLTIGFRALARELGPRELAILLLAGGSFLVVQCLWCETGAAGAALIVAGLAVLWCISPRRVPLRPEVTRE
jgi:hypothetical protein